MQRLLIVVGIIATNYGPCLCQHGNVGPPVFWPSGLGDPFHEFKPQYNFHPENYDMLLRGAPFGNDTYTQRGLENFRVFVDEYIPLLQTDPADFPGHINDDIVVPSKDGSMYIPITVYKPNNAPSIPAIVVFFHGGGLISASRHSYAGFLTSLAHESGAIVVNVGYRLLPNTDSATAPIDDALIVALWFMESTCCKELVGGHLDSKVGVAGDSHGGQLAALVANNVPGLDFQILVYPYTDMSRTQPSFTEFERIPGFADKAGLDFVYANSFADVSAEGTRCYPTFWWFFCTPQKCVMRCANGTLVSLKVLETTAGNADDALSQCKARYGSDSELPEAVTQADLYTILSLSQAGEGEHLHSVWLGARTQDDPVTSTSIFSYPSGNKLSDSWWISGSPDETPNSLVHGLLECHTNSTPWQCAIAQAGRRGVQLYNRACDCHRKRRNIVCSAPCADADKSPLINPAAASNVSASPPTLIVLAEIDGLRDAGLDYARQLERDGVQTEVIMVTGVIHGFFVFNDAFKNKSEEAMGPVAEFIRRYHRYISPDTCYEQCGVLSPTACGPYRNFTLQYDVHPENYEFLRLASPFGNETFAELGVANSRERVEMLLGALGTPYHFPGDKINMFVPDPNGDTTCIPMTVFKPETCLEIPAIAIFFHGGGLVGGSRESYENTVGRLSQESGAIFLSVEYHLLPDADLTTAPFDDAFAVARWVLESTCHKELVGGHENSKVGVVGVDYGALLAALAANNVDGLDFSVLVNPYLDVSQSQPSFQEFEFIPGIGSKASFDWLYSLTFAHIPDAVTSPLINPMAATDVSASPPTLIVTAELSALRDGAFEYGQKLELGGVQAKVVMVTGVVHDFFDFNGAFPTKFKEALDQIVEFIQMYNQYHSLFEALFDGSC